MGIREPSYPDVLRSILEGSKRIDRTIPWTLEELETFLLGHKKLNPNTVGQRLRDLARLASHPLRPVVINGTAAQLVDSFTEFESYRKTVEKKAQTAIVNDHKAVRLLGTFLNWKALRATGSLVLLDEVWPTMPTVPRRTREKLPSPEMVHDLIFAKFVQGDVERSYENALVRHMLAFDFGFGPRAPSEMFNMSLSGFDAKAHTLLVTETKKGDTQRLLYIEPEWLCCAKNRPSLNNYVTFWRPKVDVGGTDATWLKPNGEPFRSKWDLRDWLMDRAGPVAHALGFGQKGVRRFHPYMGRKWCANARLIESGYDYADTANWLGHYSVNTLRLEYEHNAKLHAKLYGAHWLTRAFRGPAKPSNSDRTPFSAPSLLFSPVKESAPAGI